MNVPSPFFEISPKYVLFLFHRSISPPYHHFLIELDCFRIYSLPTTQDPLAREIIKRVDSSPYGSKSHKRGAGSAPNKSRSAHARSQSESGVQTKIEGEPDLHSTQ